MKAFMDKDFLLDTPTARHLYHDYAADLPIIDYHCHIPPQEIYEDRRFENITQVWLGGHQVLADGSDYYFGDHYKWRVMRSNGVPEEYITGDKPDRERFQKFAEALEMAIGNPMYTWCHLELKKYFGYDGVLNGDTAEEVWNLCNEKLKNDPKMTVRGLIEQSNVAMVGTTDDPVDSLEWHKKIKEDASIKVVVAPSFRPDKALNIYKPGFVEYIHKLESVVGREFKCVGCVACAVKCRKKIIVDTFHDITKVKEKVAFVKCSGGFKASELYKKLGIQTCEEAIEKVDPLANELCTTGCCGLGSCTKVCRYDAIHVVNGTAVVDPEKCVGCKDCTYACPKHLITIVPYKGQKQVPCSSTADYEDKAKVCYSSCIACEDCKNNCPNGAIYMEDKHAVVDPELCENCNVCQYVCARKVIKEMAVPEYNYLQREALGIREGE